MCTFDGTVAASFWDTLPSRRGKRVSGNRRGVAARDEMSLRSGLAVAPVDTKTRRRARSRLDRQAVRRIAPEVIVPDRFEDLVALCARRAR